MSIGETNVGEIGQDHQEWITTRAAARRLACRPVAVRRLAQAGYLTMRALPGCDPRYLRSDVERLARESTRVAVASL